MNGNAWLWAIRQNWRRSWMRLGDDFARARAWRMSFSGKKWLRPRAPRKTALPNKSPRKPFEKGSNVLPHERFPGHAISPDDYLPSWLNAKTVDDRKVSP